MVFRLGLMILLVMSSNCDASSAQDDGTRTATPSKVLNINSLLSRDASWSEGVHDAFMEIAFDKPRSGSCEMQGPDPAYVDEMLVQFADDGSKSYERRVALVVGNSAYENGVIPLKNPSNDATSMARVLRALGFTVHRGIDLDARQLEACLASFNKNLETTPADVALFYYAGHGVQLTSAADNEKRNYMLATDAKVDASGKGRGFKQIDAVLSQMRAHSNQSVFFYDACRNDPLGDDKPQTIDGIAIKRQAALGAAEINVDTSDKESSPGILIAYATSPNKTADDAWASEASHSPFTQALLNNIARPGASIDEVLGRTFNDVGKLTNWKQTPWTSSSLTEEIKLNGEINSLEIENYSMRYASESARHRIKGRRGQAIIAALEGMPKAWPSSNANNPFITAHIELARAIKRTVVRLLGHSAEITDADFSSDGAFIITSSTDNTARIWNAATGREMSALIGHTDEVRTAEFSRDGAHAITTSDDNTAIVWDVEIGKEVFVIKTRSHNLRSATFSPNGRHIAVVYDDDTASIWNALTGKEIHTLELDKTTEDSTTRNARSGPLSKTETPNETSDEDAISVTGTRIQRSGLEAPSPVVTIDPRSFSLLDSFTLWERQPFRETRIISFSPDGGLVLIANPEAPLLRIWRVSNGKALWGIQHSLSLMNAAFSPDGRQVLVVRKEGVIEIFDAFDGNKRSDFSSERNESIQYAEFSPNRRVIAVILEDGALEVWNVLTGKAHVALEGRKLIEIYSIAFSPDGDHIIATYLDGTVDLWEATNGRKLISIIGNAGEGEGAAFSPDGRHVYSISADRSVWSVDITSYIAQHELDSDFSNLANVAFSPDGKQIITASDDGAMIWDANTGRLAYSVNSQRVRTTSARFNPDGSRIVISGGRVVEIFDTVIREVVFNLEGHDDSVNSAMFSPDGNFIVTASEDSTAIVWDSKTGQELIRLIGHNQNIYHVAFSQDGRRIVTASRDKTAIVWEAKTGMKLFSIDGHQRPVLSANFSPDGSRIVTASEDGAAIVWSTYDGKELYSLAGHGSNVWSAEYSNDGQRIVTSTENGTVHLWDAQSGAEIFSFGEDSLDVNRSLIAKKWHNYPPLAEESKPQVWKTLVSISCGGCFLSDDTYASFSPDGQLVAMRLKDKVGLWDAGPYGSELVEAAYALLTDDLRAEVERDRIRYWKLEPALLN